MSTGPSITDLLFNLDKLTRRNGVLTADCKILTDELAAARLTIEEGSYDLEEDYKKLATELKASRIRSAMLLQKYDTIRRHLHLERSGLVEFRSEMQKMFRQVADSTASDTRAIAGALRRKEEEVGAIRGALQLKGQQYSVLERRSVSETVSLNKIIDHLKAEEESSQQRRSSEISSQQKLMENGNKERILLLNQTTRLQGELRESQLETQSIKDLCVRLQQELVSKSLLNSAAEESHQRESKEKNALIQERDHLNEMLQRGIEQLMLSKDELRQEKDNNRILYSSKELLQSDFKPVLRKEDSIKKDIGLSSAEKNDVQGRLWSIQEKVRTIEVDHSREISSLKGKMVEVERERDTVLTQNFKAVSVNMELESRIKEFSMTNTQLNLQLCAMEDTIALSEVNSKNQVDKLLKELTSCRKEMTEVEISRDTLRADREMADKKSFLSSQKTVESEGQLFTAMQEIESLMLALERAAAADTARAASDVKDLKKSLALAQQTASDRETEVFCLKETIRRECEERVQNIIIIADLKEKISRQEEALYTDNGQQCSGGSLLHSANFSSFSSPKNAMTLQLSKSPCPQEQQYKEYQQYQFHQPLIQIQNTNTTGPTVPTPLGNPAQAPTHNPSLTPQWNLLGGPSGGPSGPSDGTSAKRSILINRQPEQIYSSFEPLTSTSHRISASSITLNRTPSSSMLAGLSGASEDSYLEDNTWSHQMSRKSKILKPKYRKASC